LRLREERKSGEHKQTQGHVAKMRGARTSGKGRIHERKVPYQLLY
jgi:hypothetical protein